MITIPLVLTHLFAHGSGWVLGFLLALKLGLRRRAK